MYHGAMGGRDHVASLDEFEARDLIAQLTAWLDAPRLAARETAEVVARDGNAVLLRTAFEWGCGGAAALPAAYVVDWYTGPDAERNARADYATARGKALQERWQRKHRNEPHPEFTFTVIPCSVAGGGK